MVIKKAKLNAALLVIATIELLLLAHTGATPKVKAARQLTPYNANSFVETQKFEGVNFSAASFSGTSLSYLHTEAKVLPTPISPTPTSKPKVVLATYTKTNEQKVQSIPLAPTEAEALISRYAGEYGVDPGLMLKIAKCESGFNPQAVNGPYGGMYQFIEGTWVSNRRAMGLDTNPTLRFIAEEAIKTAAFKISRDGAGAWPACSRV